MKKIALLGLMGIMVICFAGAAIAGEGRGDRKDKRSEWKKGKCCPQCMMMKKMMMSKEMIATQDGGVVLKLGNKLVKYDSGLNLVKETEISIDPKAMHDSMMKMRENCPMCKGCSKDSE
ncbi:MAG: hypothetical protein WC569_01265 [Candidatus Omnitrophota bacterium]